MQGPQFLYFLTDANGMFATFANGFMEWTGNPTPLTYTPDGWQDLSIVEEMDSKLFGLNLTYSTPQNFVEDGAGILKTIFYSLGYNGIVNVLILEQQLYFSDTEYGYYYRQMCKCAVDLTQYSHGGEKVTIKMLEGDLKAMYHANENTGYEIPITQDVAKTVLMHGLKLKQHAQGLVIQTTNPSATGTNRNVIMEIEVTSTEQKTQLGTKSTNTQTTAYRTNADIQASGRNFFSAPGQQTDLSLQWDFGLNASGGSPSDNAFMMWKVFDKDGNRVNDPSYVLQSFPIPNGSPHNHQFIGSKTVTIPANSTAYLVMLFSDNVANDESARLGVGFAFSSTTSTALDTDSNILLDYFYTYPASLVLMLDPLYIFEQLVSKLSNGKFTAQSDFLTSLRTLPGGIYDQPYSLFTSGDAVRGLTGSVLKISIGDHFQNCNATWGLGIGIINNVLRIEPKEFWLTAQGDVIPLGEGSHYQCDVWVDVLFNTINIGNANQTYDEALGDINGRYEFNMTHYYGTPVLNVNNALDLTTKARRDMYGEEYTRINLDGKKTSDSSSDNDCFENVVLPAPVAGGSTVIGPFGEEIVIPASDQPVYLLDRSINPFITGLLDNVSAFNGKISPKHCLYRSGNYIRSVLDKMDHQKVTLTKADKNTPMVTTYPNGKIVEERGAVEIGDFDPQIFKPYIFSDTTPSPEALIQSNQVKEYSFTYLNGRVMAKGFPLKISMAPVDNRAQALQLICAPDVDLLQFIDIWE
jgi:hypothetical protein